LRSAASYFNQSGVGTRTREHFRACNAGMQGEAFPKMPRKERTQHSRIRMIGLGLSLFRLLAGIHFKVGYLRRTCTHRSLRRYINAPKESFQRIPAPGMTVSSNFVHTIGRCFPMRVLERCKDRWERVQRKILNV